MTSTCQPCNSGLGSRLEASLLDWYQDALTNVRITCESIPGAMRESRVYLRESETGARVFLFPRNIHSRTRDMLETGAFNLSGDPPPRHVVKLALLKNAFLTACLWRRTVHFEGTQAGDIRAHLIAARDSQHRNVPSSAIAERLDVLRATVDQSIPLGLAVLDIPDEELAVRIVLGRSVYVSWPFDDL